ncbi:sulfur oxidation c-type cytochrome SoxX [bacterium]|nr:MAG: sulfur oxidation c-type cytochrome SoxX [bacterium]
MHHLHAACAVAFVGVLLGAPAAASSAPALQYTVAGDGIPHSLTGVPGDPTRGKALVADRKLGNCVACHQLPLDAPFQGNVGPNLAGVGSRLSVPQLRLRVVDMKLVDATTIMPAFYRVAGLNDVAQDFQGRPMLSAQQVEDVVTFLETLK